MTREREAIDSGEGSKHFFNLLKRTGYMIHQQVSRIVRSAHTVFR